jgi:hypothetical protein
VVDGGFAALALALACVDSQVPRVARLRLDAALYHPPVPPPPGKRGRKPLKGQRQRSLKVWAARADTPWEEREVDWYGGERKALWVFPRTALWYTPGQAPVAIRFVLVRDPEGKLSEAAFLCTALLATPDHVDRGRQLLQVVLGGIAPIAQYAHGARGELGRHKVHDLAG